MHPPEMVLLVKADRRRAGADILAGQTRGSTRPSGGKGLGQFPRTGAGVTAALLFFGERTMCGADYTADAVTGPSFLVQLSVTSRLPSPPAPRSHCIVRPSYRDRALA